MSEKAAILGRFQPMARHHASAIRSIVVSHPEMDLCMGIANWRGVRTKANFLTGSEAVAVAKITLKDENLTLQAHPIDIDPNTTLEKIIQEALFAHGVIHLFSGSEKTIAAARLAAHQSQYPLQIHPLIEDPKSAHATDIRNSLVRGTQVWRSLVTPSVVNYFDKHPEIIRRLRQLPDTSPENKRPWKSEASN